MYVSLKLGVNEIHVVIIIITSSSLYMLPCALTQFSKQLSNCRNMLREFSSYMWVLYSVPIFPQSRT